MLFVVKENEQLGLVYNDITLKYGNHEKFLDATINNKLSFEEYISNICKTANKNTMLTVKYITV